MEITPQEGSRRIHIIRLNEVRLFYVRNCDFGLFAESALPASFPVKEMRELLQLSGRRVTQ